MIELEKEAEEYLKKDGTKAEQILDVLNEISPIKITLKQLPFVFAMLKQIFQDGAEFGYNKANDWHYVKDGDLPKDFGNYVVCFYGAKGSVAKGKPCWEELCFDTDTLRWIDRDTSEDLPYVNKEGIVIAWKEIVLPKETE